jgi:hypothetical protein
VTDRRVDIRANRGSTIANNHIYLGDTLMVLPPSLVEHATVRDTATDYPDDATTLSIDARIVSDIQLRAETNVDLLERVLFAGGRTATVPTVRLAGLFTSLASAAQEGKTPWRQELKPIQAANYDSLMLRERELISEMIRRGYRVRVLASLDVPVILSSWGYDLRLLRIRLLDLMEQLHRYGERYPNFEFAVDSHNRLQGQFIFGRALLVRSLLTMPGVGYTLTAYETDPLEIATAMRTFDDAFSVAGSLADGIRKALNIGTMAAYTELLLSRRLEVAGIELDITP